MKLSSEVSKSIRENYETLKDHFEGKSRRVTYGELISYNQAIGFSYIQLHTENGTIIITYKEFAEYEKNKDMYNSKLYGVLE